MAVLVLLSVALPGIASARRAPTASERFEITQAARRAEGSRQLTIRVRDIRISTVGPWAAAEVSIARRGSSYVEQEAIDTFRKVHGSWIDTVSPRAPDGEIPRSVERDLGLTASSGIRGGIRTIYFLVCWFFGLAAIWDVLLQPRQAFRDAGHGKLRWLAIEVVGAPLAGIFTWGYYANRIRPAVVRAGGRPARTGLKAILSAIVAVLSAIVETASGPDGGTDPPPRRAPQFPRPDENRPRRPCYQCDRSGRLRCYHHACVNGRIHPADGSPHICRVCGGRGWEPCSTCAGEGWIE